MPEKYDISGEIDMIVKNVPYNLEPIEIVRWIYLKLGSIFSYNLKILTEYEKSIEPLNYKQNPNIPISRYQTCIQISEIFSTIINNLNIPNLSAKIIPLKLENKAYAQDHKAVEVVYGEENQDLSSKIIKDFNNINVDLAIENVEKKINKNKPGENIYIPWEVKFWLNKAINTRLNNMNKVFVDTKAKQKLLKLFP